MKEKGSSTQPDKDAMWSNCHQKTGSSARFVNSEAQYKTKIKKNFRGDSMNSLKTFLKKLVLQ